MIQGGDEECRQVGDVNDFIDAVTGERLIRVLLGGGFATRRSSRLLTLLGSCVAVCLFDPVARVGGMNHFLLPEGNDRSPPPDDGRFGVDALPWLVHSTLALGAQRQRLQAKLFGGAGAMGTRNQVGNSNIDFARQYLEQQAIPVVAEDVGKKVSRQVRFDTASGRVFVRYVDSGDGQALLRREQAARAQAGAAAERLPET